ncbi:MAG: T9SS type A sorting domain-containing protein [Bacteroidia bacterium]
MTRFTGLFFLLTALMWHNSYGYNPHSCDDSPTKTSKTLVTLPQGDTTMIVCGTSVSLTASGGASYLWSEGSAQSSATNTITGTLGQQKIVSVQVTNGTSVRLDSIFLTFAASPSIPIQVTPIPSRCGAGLVALSAASTSSKVLWYLDNTSTSVIGQGTSYTFNAPASPSTFTRHAATSNGGKYKVGPTSYNPVNNTSQSTTAGVKFNVINKLILDSVFIIPSAVNATFKIKVSLFQTGNSTALAEKEVSMSVAPSDVGQKKPISLGWVINQGNNYELRYTAITTGSNCYVSTSGTTFPYKLPGAIHLTSANASLSTYFPYFFDWHVTLLGCESIRTQFSATIKDAPIVMPLSVVSCSGSATLNAIAGTGATNPTGTTYAWISGTNASVGSTETVNISAPINNSYRVIANLPSTSCKDTGWANVYLPAGGSGSAPTGSSVSRCGPGTVTFTGLSGNSSQYIWYNAPAGGTMLGVGTSFTTPVISSTTTYYVAGVNGGTDIFAPAQPSSITNSTLSPPSGTPNTQGQIFEVYVPIVLSSVTVYPKTASTSTNPAIFEVSLYQGGVLQTTIPFSINNFLVGNATVLPLNIPVNPGTDYRLTIKSISNTSLFYTTMSNGSAIPYGTNNSSASMILQGGAKITGGASSLTGTNNNNYYYLYNWNVYVVGCPSITRTPLTATINPQPILSLPSVSTACSGSVNLSAGVTNPTAGTGLTYTWTPGGSNASNITVSTAGTYTVSSSFSNSPATCASTATTSVILSTNPTGTVTTGANVLRCNAGAVTLTATGGNGAKMLWFKNLSAPTAPATDSIVGVGNSYTYNATSTKTYYATSVNGSQSTTGALNPGIGTAPYGSLSQGLKFDVSIPIVLEQVSVYFKNLGQTIFKIQLKNTSNQVIREKLFSLNVNSIGTEVVLDLDFPINPGTDYKLTFLTLLGGNQLSFNTSGVIYPYSTPNILTIKSSTNTSSSITANYYYYFYKWKVFIPGCATSPRKPQTVTVSPFTVPNLPAYIDTCATSYILKPYGSATPPAGYTYSWSPTTATSATLNATTANTYTVVVTDPATTCKDTVSSVVSFSSAPSTPLASDIQKCGGGLVTMTANSPGADKLLWYNVGSSAIQKIGTSYALTLNASANFLVSAANGASGVLVGKPDNTGQTSSATSGTMNFNVTKPIIIESVNAYLVAPGSFKVRLLNAQNLLLQEKQFNFPNTAGLVTVNLDFGVAQGNGYKLQFVSVANSKLVFNTTNLAFPYTLPGIMSITGTSLTTSNFNAIFYNWSIFVVGCESAKKTVAVSILPIPTLTNPVVLPVCAASTVLSANSVAQPNVTYTWTPGSTTGLTKTVTATGTYEVIAKYSAAAGGCSDTAATSVTIFNQQPSTPTAPAVTRCGPGAIDVVASAPNSNLILWYNTAASDTIIGVGGTYTHTATAAPSIKTLHTSAAFGSTTSLGPVDNTFGTSFIGTAAEGVRFTVSQDVVLRSVYIFPLYPDPQFKIELFDPAVSSTVPKYSKTFALNNVSGKTEVQLGFFLDYVAASGSSEKEYRIKYVPILNAGVSANSSNVDYSNYKRQGVARMIGAFSSSNDASYFFMYDWQLYVVGCTSPRTSVTAQAKQIPALNTPSVYANCNNTGSSVSVAPTNPPNPTGTTYSWVAPNGTVTPTTGTSPAAFLVDINTSGLYTATALYQGCATTATISAYIGNTPAAPTAVSPQTFCGIGYYDLVATAPATSSAQNLLWYTSNPATNPNANPVGIGSPFNTLLSSPSTIYYVAASEGGRVNVGEADIYANGTKAASTTSTGIKFDVIETDGLFIDKVYVYPVSNKMRFNLLVYDKTGAIIYQQYINKITGVSAGAKTAIKLGLFLPADVDYKMVYQHVAGLTGNTGCYVKTSGFAFPYTLNQVIKLQSNTLSTIYSYFFDWETYVPKCIGSATTILAKVNSAVQVDIDGTDDGQMFSCNSIPIVAINSIPAPTGVTYAWYSNSSPTTPLATTNSYTISSPNTYWVTATQSGCTVSDTVTVNISQDLGLADDGILCSNQLITNYGPTPPAGVSFLWSTGATTPSITVSQPGTYFVQAQDPSGCPLADTVVVSGFDVPPVSNLPELTSGCPSITLDPQAWGSQLAYSWSTGALTDTLVVTATGTYWVQVTNANGCSVYDSTNFLLTTPPSPTFTYIAGGGTTLNFNNTSPAGYNYSWYFGANATPPSTTTPNPTPVSATYPATGFYTATLCIEDPTGACPIQSCTNLQVMVSVEDGLSPTKAFSVYPNPTQFELFIDTKVSHSQTVNLELMDINGRVLKEASEIVSPNNPQRLGLEGITSGIYLLRVTSDEQEEVFKVMVE